MNSKKIENDFYLENCPWAETRAAGPHAQCVWPPWPSVNGAHHVDGPRHWPHGTQGTRGTCPGATMVHRARGVAWAEMASGWTVGRKVNTGIIHGPRHTHLTRLWTRGWTEEVGRRCGGSSPAQRRCCGSSVEKVLVPPVGEQLRSSVKLQDLHKEAERHLVTLSMVVAAGEEQGRRRLLIRADRGTSARTNCNR
jgi:hypothetical protein